MTNLRITRLNNKILLPIYIFVFFYVVLTKNYQIRDFSYIHHTRCSDSILPHYCLILLITHIGSVAMQTLWDQQKLLEEACLVNYGIYEQCLIMESGLY